MEMNAYRDDDEHDGQRLLEESPPVSSKRPIRTSWDWTKRSMILSVGFIALILFFLASQIRRPSDRAESIAPGIKLRILPVGDSITEGYRSTDKNGYRNALLQDLEQVGSEVEFIGSEAAGNMSKPQHCGFGGYTIEQIDGKVDGCLTGPKPNMILLHAGTNDMDRIPQDGPYDEAPARLGKLIDHLFTLAPDAAMVIARLVSSEAPDTAMRVGIFNEEIPKVVEERVAKGRKIVVVDMESIGRDADTSADGLHPNDVGYAMMAGFWMEGLRELSGKGWISAAR